MLQSDAGNVIRQTASIQSFTHPCTYILAAGLIQEKRLSGTVTPEAKKRKRNIEHLALNMLNITYQTINKFGGFLCYGLCSNFGNADPDNNCK